MLHSRFNHQTDQIVIENFMLSVCETLEFFKSRQKFIVRFELKSEFVYALLECMSPGVLAQYHFARCPSHILRSHNFVGLSIFDHTVLMNSRLMRKRVGTYNRFVRLYRKPGHTRNQTTCRNDLGGIDIGVTVEEILTSPNRHHDLFKRSIAGSFAQPVDCTLNLSGAFQNRSQRISDGNAQIIVAMYRKNRLV